MYQWFRHYQWTQIFYDRIIHTQGPVLVRLATALQKYTLDRIRSPYTTNTTHTGEWVLLSHLTHRKTPRLTNIKDWQTLVWWSWKLDTNCDTEKTVQMHRSKLVPQYRHQSRLFLFLFYCSESSPYNCCHKHRKTQQTIE